MQIMMLFCVKIQRKTWTVKGDSQRTVWITGGPPRFSLGGQRTVCGSGGPFGIHFGLELLIDLNIYWARVVIGLECLLGLRTVGPRF